MNMIYAILLVLTLIFLPPVGVAILLVLLAYLVVKAARRKDK